MVVSQREMAKGQGAKGQVKREWQWGMGDRDVEAFGIRHWAFEGHAEASTPSSVDTGSGLSACRGPVARERESAADGDSFHSSG